MDRPWIAPLAVMAAGAHAAPNIPSSELPGRARQQFQESPIDRFTQPSQKSAPLWQWDVHPGEGQGPQHSRRDSSRC